jgi:hypothetical protein
MCVSGTGLDSRRIVIACIRGIQVILGEHVLDDDEQAAERDGDEAVDKAAVKPSRNWHMCVSGTGLDSRRIVIACINALIAGALSYTPARTHSNSEEYKSFLASMYWTMTSKPPSGTATRLYPGFAELTYVCIGNGTGFTQDRHRLYQRLDRRRGRKSGGQRNRDGKKHDRLRTMDPAATE